MGKNTLQCQVLVLTFDAVLALYSFSVGGATDAAARRGAGGEQLLASPVCVQRLGRWHASTCAMAFHAGEGRGMLLKVRGKRSGYGLDAQACSSSSRSSSIVLGSWCLISSSGFFGWCPRRCSGCAREAYRVFYTSCVYPPKKNRRERSIVVFVHRRSSPRRKPAGFPCPAFALTSFPLVSSLFADLVPCPPRSTPPPPNHPLLTPPSPYSHGHRRRRRPLGHFPPRLLPLPHPLACQRRRRRRLRRLGFRSSSLLWRCQIAHPRRRRHRRGRITARHGGSGACGDDGAATVGAPLFGPGGGGVRGAGSPRGLGSGAAGDSAGPPPPVLPRAAGGGASRTGEGMGE